MKTIQETIGFLKLTLIIPLLLVLITAGDCGDEKKETWFNPNWSFNIVTKEAGHFGDFEIGTDGSLHFIYYDIAYSELIEIGYSLGYAVYSNGKYHANDHLAAKGNSYDRSFHAALALDKNNIPHIAYYYDNVITQSLRYTTLSNGTWVKEIVKSGNQLGKNPDIAVDTNGAPYITCNGSSDMFYITNNNIFSTNIQFGGYKIKIDDNNVFHFITTEYKILSNGFWNTENINEAPINSSWSFALDSSNNPHILYLNNNSLQYYHKIDSSWVKETISDAYLPGGSSPDITIANNDLVYIVYKDKQEYTACAYKSNNNWHKEQISDEVVFGWVNYKIRIDSSGRVHVVYLRNYVNGIEGRYGLVHAVKN